MCGVGVPEGGEGLKGTGPYQMLHERLYTVVGRWTVSASVCNNVKCCKLLSSLPVMWQSALCCTPSMGMSQLSLDIVL